MDPSTVNPNTDDCCMNCRFFQVSETDDYPHNRFPFPYTLCLRFPPVPIANGAHTTMTKNGNVNTGTFPSVKPTWWCGEHKPK